MKFDNITYHTLKADGVTIGLRAAPRVRVRGGSRCAQVNDAGQGPPAACVEVCIEERVPVLSLFWGDPSPYVEAAHAAGIAVIDQVGSVAAAERSARAGVDAIIAQGVEAGGHVAGEVTTMVLAPRVVDAVAPVPLPRFMGLPPSAATTGDIDSMNLLAGQSAGLVRDMRPAADIVRELVDGARAIIEGRLTGALAAARA
jgi:NAD(P)H-dependent flavin oxidoreductase YrpB (nitropropane dioxygenase family)